MNHKLSYIFILLFALPSYICAQQNNDLILKDVRENMQYGFKDEKVCNQLYDKVKNIKNPETVLKGYIGAVYIARSRCVPLFDKMATLRKGEELLDGAIKTEPENVELIFLRLSIQLNLPGFLGYNDNIETDKKFVFNNYKKATPVLKTKIINFVNTSGHFTDNEKSKVTE